MKANTQGQASKQSATDHHGDDSNEAALKRFWTEPNPMHPNAKVLARPVMPRTLPVKDHRDLPTPFAVHATA